MCHSEPSGATAKNLAANSAAHPIPRSFGKKASQDDKEFELRNQSQHSAMLMQMIDMVKGR